MTGDESKSKPNKKHVTPEGVPEPANSTVIKKMDTESVRISLSLNHLFILISFISAVTAGSWYLSSAYSDIKTELKRNTESIGKMQETIKSFQGVNPYYVDLKIDINKIKIKVDSIESKMK